MDSFLNGIFLGAAVAIPFGPVNILILAYALKNFKNSLAVGFGAFSADMAYLISLNLGVLTFLSNEIFLKCLSVFGFCFLTYMAFCMIREKEEELSLENQNINESILKSYLKGFALNALNPFVIGFWLSVAGILSSKDHSYALILGLVGMILIWVFSLSFFVSKYKHIFNAKVIKWINIISAIVIEYFAISLIYKNFFE